MKAKIKSLHTNRLRSLENVVVSNCGNFNVIIGKNNAGKSNILHSINLILSHLKTGNIVTPLLIEKPQHEFTDKLIERPFQIGIEFELPSEAKNHLISKIKEESPSIERATEILQTEKTINFIVSACVDNNTYFLFISSIYTNGISNKNGFLESDGICLLKVTSEAAIELFRADHKLRNFRGEINYLDDLIKDKKRPAYPMHRMRDIPVSESPIYSTHFNEVDRQYKFKIKELLGDLKSEEQVIKLNELIDIANSEIEKIENSKITNSLSSFVGEANQIPKYINWLIDKYGSIPLLYLKERREPIGRNEATQLLRLKNKRGGNEKFDSVKKIVKDLLNAEIDVYAYGDNDEPQIEIDIDNFLAEANGTGIKEALRLALDLEFKDYGIVLIEEPEIHLHPGLAGSMYSYLQEKSNNIQIFCTTHSTNFIDHIYFKNTYLVSPNEQKKTICKQVENEDDLLTIPTEIGLSLSTVFMHDRIIFVEGKSDEAIFREFAKKIKHQLPQKKCYLCTN